MAFQMHVWSTFDFSKIGSELTYNDLRIVWLKMQCEKGGLNMPVGPKTSETREGWLKLAWRSRNLKKVGLNWPGRVNNSNRLP